MFRYEQGPIWSWIVLLGPYQTLPDPFISLRLGSVTHFHPGDGYSACQLIGVDGSRCRAEVKQGSPTLFETDPRIPERDVILNLGKPEDISQENRRKDITQTPYSTLNRHAS